jgi:hypothetical protein
LTEQQAYVPGGGMDEHDVAFLDRVDAAQQELRGEPREQGGGGTLVVEIVRQGDNPRSADHPFLRIGAGRPAGIGDAIARL